MASERVQRRIRDNADEGEAEGLDLAQFERALRIDRHALDDALEKQPDVFYRVANALALAISRRDLAKTRLQETEAEAEHEFRRSAARSGDKITEGEVKNAVRLDKGVQARQAKLHKLNTEVGQWGALKEAFTQRSYAIKDLSALYIASYYGDIAGDAANKNARAKHAREAMNEMRHRR